MISYASKAIVNGGIAGALLGGAFSAAKNTKAVKDSAITKEEAINNVAKDVAGSGLATAAGVCAAGLIGLTGIGALIVVTGATAGAKYVWDNSVVNKKKAKPVKKTEIIEAEIITEEEKETEEEKGEKI